MKVLYLLVSILTCIVSDERVMEEWRDGNAQFSFNAYKELTKVSNESFLFSPISLALLMATIQAGAHGATREEIIEGLHFPHHKNDRHEAIEHVIKSTSNIRGSLVRTGNKIYINQNLTVRPLYKHMAAHIFNTEVDLVDFSSKQNIVDMINDVIKNLTRDNIDTLIDENDLSGNVQAALVDALYFNGRWAKPFDIEESSPNTFYVTDRDTPTVWMMEQLDTFDYYEDENLEAQFLRLKYAWSSTSITFVLPQERNGLQRLEDQLGSSLPVPVFSSKQVHVQIPYVNIENTIDFVPILENLGIKTPFSSSANFRDMIVEDVFLPISKVFQTTLIKISENGTFGASSAIGINSDKLASAKFGVIDDVKDFKADHPFIFYITNQLGVIFAGRYLGPPLVLE